MEYIIIGVLILIVVVLFFKKQKTKEIIKEVIIEKKVELDDSEIKEWNERKEHIKKEYYNLEQELRKTHQKRVEDYTQKQTELNCGYENEVEKKKTELQHYEEIEKQKIITKLDRENERLRQEKIKEFSKFIKEQEEEIEVGNVEIEDLKQDLERLKSIRAAAIEGFKKEEEVRSQKTFYSIEFSDGDIEDIHELSKIKLNNREAINKLIFDVYYRGPLNAMLNRVVGKEKTCGIYKITNVNNDKAYIGKSTDIKKRWTEHVKSSLDIGTIAKQNIHLAIKKEGIENFTFQIVEVCDKDVYSEREKFWIGFHKTMEYGFNSREG